MYCACIGNTGSFKMLVHVQYISIRVELVSIDFYNNPVILGCLLYYHGQYINIKQQGQDLKSIEKLYTNLIVACC